MVTLQYHRLLLLPNFCAVSIHSINSLEITLILQPACSDVKIDRSVYTETGYVSDLTPRLSHVHRSTSALSFLGKEVLCLLFNFARKPLGRIIYISKLELKSNLRVAINFRLYLLWT